jgi:hypothetical protein
VSSATRAKQAAVVFLGLSMGATIYIGFNEDRWGPLVWSLIGMATGGSIVALTWEVARRTYERDDG